MSLETREIKLWGGISRFSARISRAWERKNCVQFSAPRRRSLRVIVFYWVATDVTKWQRIRPAVLCSVCSPGWRAEKVTIAKHDQQRVWRWQQHSWASGHTPCFACEGVGLCDKETPLSNPVRLHFRKQSLRVRVSLTRCYVGFKVLPSNQVSLEAVSNLRTCKLVESSVQKKKKVWA